MYIDRATAEKLLQESKDRIASELKGKSDFVLSLLDDDDWSMVIKSHALIESIATELIVTRIDQPQTKNFIERLPLSDEQIGKLRLAKDFDLISANGRNFVRAFSTLRNNLVHKVENLTFKFSDHVASLDHNQKKQWQSTYTWYEREDDHNGKNSWKDATLKNPKLAVLMAVFMFAMHHSIRSTELQTAKSVQLASQETMKRLLTP